MNRHRFVGYSLSETVRAKDELARIFECRPAEVYCPVLEDRERILRYVRTVPYEIIELRGEADSSRWVTDQGVARLVLAMTERGSTEPVGLSVPLDSGYGFRDACLSVPVRPDREGWTKVVEWDLADEELEGLQAAYKSVNAEL